jgi:hypothetical protein
MKFFLGHKPKSFISANLPQPFKCAKDGEKWLHRRLNFRNQTSLWIWEWMQTFRMPGLLWESIDSLFSVTMRWAGSLSRTEKTQVHTLIICTQELAPVWSTCQRFGTRNKSWRAFQWGIVLLWNTGSSTRIPMWIGSILGSLSDQETVKWSCVTDCRIKEHKSWREFWIGLGDPRQWLTKSLTSESNAHKKYGNSLCFYMYTCCMF